MTVTTVDAYCMDADITHIHGLKTDTQGFDLEVLRGATRMLSERRVDLVLTEITFCDLYAGQPTLEDLFVFFRRHDFSLVSFYTPHFRNGRVGWTDALFVRT